MKIMSFNINGLRARLHQLSAIIEKHQPDILGLQEIKVDDEQFPLADVQAFGYEVTYHGQKGHYGVAMMTKTPANSVIKGLPNEPEEAQRRMIMTEHSLADGGTLYVYNGYFPQGESQDHPVKFPYKREFYANLYQCLSQHQADDAVIVMGDMNISHQDLDIGIGEQNKKRWLRTGKCSFLPEEREWLNRIMDLGYHDSFRSLHPEVNDRFSWFDYRSKGFDDNRGLRIDLIIATAKVHHGLTEAGIDYELRGIEKPSDHAPIWACYDL